MLRTRRLAPLAAALALVLAACGGAEDPAAAPDPDALDDPTEDDGDTDTGDDPGDDDGDTGAGDDDPGDTGAGDVEDGGDVDVGTLGAEVAAALEELGGDARVVEAQRVTWPDGALGCPEPGMMYTQALVDGYRIVLEDDQGQQVAFHGEDGAAPFRCDDPQEPTS